MYIKHKALSTLELSSLKLSATSIALGGYPFCFKYHLSNPSLSNANVNITTTEITSEGSLDLSDFYIDIDKPIIIKSHDNASNYSVEFQEGSRIHIQTNFTPSKHLLYLNLRPRIHYIEYDDSGFSIRDNNLSKIVIASRRNEIELFASKDQYKYIIYRTKATLHAEIGADAPIEAGDYTLNLDCALSLGNKRSHVNAVNLNFSNFIFKSENHKTSIEGDISYNPSVTAKPSGAIKITISRLENFAKFIGSLTTPENARLVQHFLYALSKTQVPINAAHTHNPEEVVLELKSQTVGWYLYNFTTRVFK